MKRILCRLCNESPPYLGGGGHDALPSPIRHFFLGGKGRVPLFPAGFTYANVSEDHRSHLWTHSRAQYAMIICRSQLLAKVVPFVG